MVRGAALDGSGDDFSGPLIRLVLVLRFDLLDLHGHFVGHIVSDVGNQVGLGLIHGEAGDLFQHLKLTLLYQGNFLLLIFHGSNLVVERVALFLNGIYLPVEVFLLLLKAAFLLLELASALLDFPLILGAAFVYFFLCLNESFSFLALSTLY